MKNKLSSLILAAALCLNGTPVRAMAAQENAIPCDHHPAHTAECGYAEGPPEAPCGFVCPDCATREQDEPSLTRDEPSPTQCEPSLTQDEPSPTQNEPSLTRDEPPENTPAEEVGIPEEAQAAPPYYLYLQHSLEIEGSLYGYCEQIQLSQADFADGSYDLRCHILKKEGMDIVSAELPNREAPLPAESWTLSPEDFEAAGNPEDGSAYYGAQVLFTYRMLEGYRAVLPEEPTPPDDPYGLMPMTSFEGGNIQDITFVPADVITLRISCLYSPTGELAGTQAADSQVYQLAVPDVQRDGAGNITGAGPVSGTWALPCYGDADRVSYPGLEDFRIVLNPAPLNAFLNDPALADRATSGSATSQEIQDALKNDLFTVNSDNSSMPVYQWQLQQGNPPGSDSGYPQNQLYSNSYTDLYNEAWESAREIEDALFSAKASSNPPREHQGANPLAAPELTVHLTAQQCVRVLNSDSREIAVTVYYRRSDHCYHVAHWVSGENLSAAAQAQYRGRYPEYNDPAAAAPDSPLNRGYFMVYLECRQGRLGAMTNARANPAGEGADILRSFAPRDFSQKAIGHDTRVDILYAAANQYSLIFDTDDAYIPRQHIQMQDSVAFTPDSMTVLRNGAETTISEYDVPSRTGYLFRGWKYEVKALADSDQEYMETAGAAARYYKAIPNDGTAWEITEDMISKAVIARTDDPEDTVKIIYLSPIWEPASASVRVVFWTEDLSGGDRDVRVEVDDTPGAAGYREQVHDYLDGTPHAVCSSFSNVGSFTFTAKTGQLLDLSVTDRQLSTANAETFQASDAAGQYSLSQLIGRMFAIRMPEAATSFRPVNTSEFYHPCRTDHGTYTVAADGSTVINVYYARNVYQLGFTYYGSITGSNKSGLNRTGPPGLVVATNTVGYSLGDNPDSYDYQSSPVENRWELVADPDSPGWTVPEKIVISAKYGADLRQVWPCSNSETMSLTLESNHSRPYQSVATFVSWGTTAGPFNQKFKADRAANREGESTIMGAYRSMSADIIADPKNPDITHHLYGYWWNEGLSFYRFNACYEVPGLTGGALLCAPDLRTCDLTERGFVYNDQTEKPPAITPMAVSDQEKVRRDTLYLIPVGGSLESYFEDYKDALIRVDSQGTEQEDGPYYALRRGEIDDSSRVYALARQVTASSSNYIQAQTPSAEVNLTPVNSIADHDTQVWDDWGRTCHDGTTVILWLGSPERPFDLFFYYDRTRFQITYMVPARNSASGEYTIGTTATVSGESLGKYNVPLTSDHKNSSSGDPEFARYWIPADNRQSPGGTGLDQKGYTRLAPDSAEAGKGQWLFQGWALDRAGTAPMTADGWNGSVSGNLRLFAQWEPPVYLVKFDFGGGTYNDSQDFPIQKVLANRGYTSSGKPIPRPVRNGYVLNGWTWYAAQQSGENDLTAVTRVDDFNFEKPITQDMVLCANWSSVASETYNYKIWYLTDEEDAVPIEKPEDTDGQWLPGNAWGTLRPAPDPNPPGGVDPAEFTHVLGCQYFEDQTLPASASLPLTAIPIPGYVPVKVNEVLTLDSAKNGQGAGTTQNVAYFYYRKNLVKSYKIRFQLFDRAGEDGILEAFTTQSVIADGAYFTPGRESFQALRDAGYQLVQMDGEGIVKKDADGRPLAAGSYRDLDAFIEAENTRFWALDQGCEALVTFKVMPISYTIGYRVGSLKGSTQTADSYLALRAAMQAALDRLGGGAVRESVAAGKNPTLYQVTDFSNNYKFVFRNPAPVQNPENCGEWWKFIGWSPAPGTSVITDSRASNGEYATLELESSVGDLVFLANWEPVDSSGDAMPTVPPAEPSVEGPALPMPPEQEPVRQPGTGSPDAMNPAVADSAAARAEGVPETQQRVWNPETGDWIYVPKRAAGNGNVPNTGDDSADFWILLCALSLSGLAALYGMTSHTRSKDG